MAETETRVRARVCPSCESNSKGTRKTTGNARPGWYWCRDPWHNHEPATPDIQRGGDEAVKLWLIFVQGDDTTWLEAAWDDYSKADNESGWREEVERVRKLAFDNDYEMRIWSTTGSGIYEMFDPPELHRVHQGGNRKDPPIMTPSKESEARADECPQCGSTNPAERLSFVDEMGLSHTADEHCPHPFHEPAQADTPGEARVAPKHEEPIRFPIPHLGIEVVVTRPATPTGREEAQALKCTCITGAEEDVIEYHEDYCALRYPASPELPRAAPSGRETAEARPDWVLRGRGEGNRPELSGPDLPEDAVVALVAVPSTRCPDCNLGDSGCSTCADFTVLRRPAPTETAEARVQSTEEDRERVREHISDLQERVDTVSRGVMDSPGSRFYRDQLTATIESLFVVLADATSTDTLRTERDGARSAYYAADAERQHAQAEVERLRGALEEIANLAPGWQPLIRAALEGTPEGANTAPKSEKPHGQGDSGTPEGTE